MNNNYDIDKIFDIVLAFNSEMRYEEMLNLILTKMMEITNSDAGTLYILEDDELHFRIIKNISLGIHQSVGETIGWPPIKLDKNDIKNVSAHTAINNEVVIIDDVYEDERFNFSGPKNYDKLTGYRSRSMLVLPLTTYWHKNMEVLGVIQLLNPIDPHTKNVGLYGDILSPPIIPALANVAANTLANLLRLKEIQMLFQSFVSSMVCAIDERSKYNSNHTQKVTELCGTFARYLNNHFPEGHPYHFSDIHLEELTMAAMLHDIGKIITPLNIMDKADRLGERIEVIQNRFEIKKLQIENDMLKHQISENEHNVELERLDNAFKLVKTASATDYLTDEMALDILRLEEFTYKNSKGKIVPLFDPDDIEALSIRKGTLTPKEREVMKEHAAATNRILHNIAFKKYYKNVRTWAVSHHEFMDGSGYPQGLKGSSLTPEICIITIMDIFEALTANDRPYKKAMSVEKAFEILNEMAVSGKLHQELVELFKESKVWLKTPTYGSVGE